MKLVLTDSVTSKEVVIDSEAIKLFEPAIDGSAGTHIVLGPSLGRQVNETPAAIAAALGVVVPQPAPSGATVKSVAKKHIF